MIKWIVGTVRKAVAAILSEPEEIIPYELEIHPALLKADKHPDLRFFTIEEIEVTPNCKSLCLVAHYVKLAQHIEEHLTKGTFHVTEKDIEDTEVIAFGLNSVQEGKDLCYKFYPSIPFRPKKQ